MFAVALSSGILVAYSLFYSICALENPDFFLCFQAVVFLRCDSFPGRLAISSFLAINFVPFFAYPFLFLPQTAKDKVYRFSILIYTTHKRFLKTKKLVVTLCERHRTHRANAHNIFNNFQPKLRLDAGFVR